METRQKTQEQFVELKEATVTDLMNLQSQMSQSASQVSGLVDQAVNSRLSRQSESAGLVEELSLAMRELDSRVGSEGQMRGKLEQRMGAIERAHADESERLEGEIKSMFEEVAAKQLRLYDGAVALVQESKDQTSQAQHQLRADVDSIQRSIQQTEQDLTNSVELRLGPMTTKLGEIQATSDASGAELERVRGLHNSAIANFEAQLQHLREQVAARQDAGGVQSLQQEMQSLSQQCKAEIERMQIQQTRNEQREVKLDSEWKASIGDLKAKLTEMVESLEEQTEYNLNLIPPKLAELRVYIDAQLAKLSSEDGSNLVSEVAAAQQKVQQELVEIKHNTATVLGEIATEQAQSVEKLVLRRSAKLEEELDALRTATSTEVAETNRLMDSRLKELNDRIEDSAAALQAEDAKRDLILDTKVARVCDHVNDLFQETSAGMQAVVHTTNTELSKTENKLRTIVSQQSEQLQQSILDMREETAEVQDDLVFLAQDVVNNRGALMDLKADEGRLQSVRRHSMQTQLQQFKREAMAEVEAIKRSTERRKFRQEKFRAPTPTGT